MVVERKLVCMLCGQDWDGRGGVCPHCYSESVTIEVVMGVKPLGKSPIQTIKEQQKTTGTAKTIKEIRE